MEKRDPRLEKYQAFWSSGATGDWVLLRGRAGRPAVPFNVKTQLAMVIEDEELATAVVKRMLEAGVRVVDHLPGPRKP
jgi:hypothetical protein